MFLRILGVIGSFYMFWRGLKEENSAVVVVAILFLYIIFI